MATKKKGKIGKGYPEVLFAPKKKAAKKTTTRPKGK